METGSSIVPGLPRGRVALARLALAWERLWPALWPATFAVGAFLAVALLGLLPLLPGWLHLAVLAAVAITLGATLFLGVRAFRLPGAPAALRRLEQDSGLQHRPISALSDSLASGRMDPGTIALWQAHLRRMRSDIRRLRLAPPRAGLARHDPFGLRAGLLLMLIIALAAAQGGVRERLARALMPDIAGLGPPPAVSLDLWITPPAYTGAAPVFVSTAPGAEPQTKPIAVPIGSVVLAQLHGGKGRPVLKIGEADAAFAEIDPGTWRAEGKIAGGNRVSVAQDGSPVASWPIAVMPDNPPTIAFARPPASTERNALRIEHEAGDDYGVERVRGIIRRADGATGPAGIASIELTLPMARAGLKESHGASYHDFTPHPWAGIPVVMMLEARDALDQVGKSETIAFVLPERAFTHPVARAIIEQRKQLTVAPERQAAIAAALHAIGADTAAYDGDPVVMLALSIAEHRLVEERGAQTVTDVQALLWDTALRLEDGDLALAEAELRAAQQALQDALAGDASDEEIQRLMDQLQAALDRFLSALADQARRSQATQQDQAQLDPNAMRLQRQDLQRMLDQARELARTGARDAARNMLSQLQEMLENLRANPMAGAQRPGAAQASRLLRDLDALTQRQQELLDRSFRQSQQLQAGDQGPDTGADARQQEALRRGLGDVMRRFGEMTGDIPRPLGRAERAMRGATEALQRGDPGGAVDPQSRALSELQQGARAMLEQMMQAFGRDQMPANGRDRNGQPRDPLGRNNESGMGMIDTGDVQIPDKADVQRAREILDELRRRAGERTRPKLEREYIDRLLRRF